MQALARVRVALLSRTRDNLLATALCFVAVVALTSVSGFGVLVWSLVALASGGTGWLLDLLLVGLLAGAGGGAVLAVLSLVALCYGVCVRVSTALRRAGTRVILRAEAIERQNPVVRFVGLSEWLADLDPRSTSARAVDRIDYLKARYVEGTLSESEFERRVNDALGSVSGRSAPARIENRRRGHHRGRSDTVDRLREITEPGVRESGRERETCDR